MKSALRWLIPLGLVLFCLGCFSPTDWMPDDTPTMEQADADSRAESVDPLLVDHPVPTGVLDPTALDAPDLALLDARALDPLREHPPNDWGERGGSCVLMGHLRCGVESGRFSGADFMYGTRG